MNDINELLGDLDRMWEQLGPDSRWMRDNLDKCAETIRSLQAENELLTKAYKQDALRYQHIRRKIGIADRHEQDEYVGKIYGEQLDAYIDKEIRRSQKPEEAAEQLQAESEQLGFYSEGNHNALD